MNFRNCTFYGLKSKQKLKELLLINRDVYFKSSFINSKISLFIKSDRIIECPDDDIKAIQKNILSKLRLIGMPDYVFSGVKGKSFKDILPINLRYKYHYYLDLKKFFYNVSRNIVYDFYKIHLNTSPDIAAILTDYSALNLKKKNLNGLPEIKSLLKNGTIKPNHLIAGAPQSPLLSFYANINMFEDIFQKAKNQGINFLVYVDDLFFSSQNAISDEFIISIKDILRIHGYSVQESKTNRKYND